MLNTLKKIPKKISIPLFIFAVIVFIITAILLNLEKIVEKVSSRFINGRVVIEDIDLSFSKPVIKNITLYDDKNNVLFNSPEVTANISFKNLKQGRIDELNINSAIVNVVRDKDGVINFTKLSKTKSEEKPKNPLNKVVVSNARVNYEDYTFPTKLERKVEDINATVTASKQKLVETAHINIEDENIQLETLFKDESNDKLASLQGELRIDKFLLDKDLLKSLVNNKKIHFSDVNIISDLSFKTDKTVKNTYITGNLDIISEFFRYDDIDSDIKDIRLSSKFNGRDGEANLGLNIFGKNKDFSLAYKDEELNSVITFDRVDESILNKIVPIREKKLDLKNINLEDIKTIVHYSDNRGLSIKTTMKPNNSEFKGIELNDFNLYISSKAGKNNLSARILTKVKGIPENIALSVENQKDNTDVILALKSPIKDNIVPDINVKAKIENKKDILKANIDSNIVDFNVDYNKDKKLTKVYGDKFTINYDVDKKKLTNGEGRIPFELYHTANYLDFVAKNNKIQIKELKLADKTNKNSYFIAKGNANLDNGEFNIDYEGNSTSIKRKFKENDIILSFDGKGKVENKNNILSSQGQINDLSLEYIGKIEKINGTYDLKKIGKNVEANVNTKIASIGYDKYDFKNFNLGVNYSGNQVKIKDFSNNLISLKGDYDVKNEKVNANLSVNRITNKDVAFDKAEFVLENLKANVEGDIKNLQGAVDLGSTVITLPSKDFVKITGKASIKNSIVNISGINLDNNLITGKYNLKDKNLDLKVSLSEKHLEKYYGGKDLGYMLYGQIDVKGVAGKIKAIAKGRATNFEKKLPDLAYDVEYNAENYSDGILSISGLDIIDKKYGDLLGVKGQINLKEKTLDIRNKNKQMDLVKLQGILGNPNIRGTVNTDLVINGTFDNPSYKLNIFSSETSIKTFKINDISIDLTGDKEKANLNKLNLDIYKNLIVGNGYYDIKNKTYSVIVKSNNKIDVSKFQPFFTPYGIENVKGKIALNVEVNEKTEKGYINLENISLESTKAKLKLANFNGPISFNGRNIKIENIKANLNNSPLDIDGFVDFTDFASLPKDDLIRTLPYKLHFKMNNFNYFYPEVIKLSASTELTITNEEVYGNLIIKDATIYDIPNNYYRDFFSLIREQLRKRRTDVASTKKQDKQSKTDKEKVEEIQRMLNKLMPIDFIVRTEKPILIDMDNFNIAVPEVYGKLHVDLNLNGKNGKYYITGESELKEGYFFVGTNEFKVDRALAVFNENVPLPEINPNIFFESTIEMDDEEYHFNTIGKVNQLRYEILSRTAKVGGDLSALIVNPNADDNIYAYGQGNEIFITFMKNLIAGQVGQIVFVNTTRYIKRKFDLTKFIIRPEVKIYNSDSSVNRIGGTTDNRGLNPEIYNVNIKLEAKDNIYKDKLFWKANVRIIGTGKDVIKNQTMKVDSKVREYDVGLEYKVDDSKTIEIGVGTVPDKYRTDPDKDYRKPNYHIGFKFRKRYRDFSEIFSF
ncbi:translocation/assembly module TamB domain-containing protein [Fusobacterium hwasookii]|uniref:translocation/assembly module TamB domain-containing protein n=1 Tax=Fusobacterium hwasookii TaxID=1583098 RepID=UPI0004953340|nr:UbiD family decarboxylase [Fusobacterium hwasookii]ALQ38289.1 UbiD family decarboxylase [Fusobacterium hwasookii ChDC F300]